MTESNDERVKALNKKRELKPVEYAFTLAWGLQVGAQTLREGQRRQLKIDPAWTEVDIKPEDTDRLADFSERLLEVLTFHARRARAHAAMTSRRIIVKGKAAAGSKSGGPKER